MELVEAMIYQDQLYLENYSVVLPSPVPTTMPSSSESYKRDKFHSPNLDQDDNSSRNSTVSSIELINSIVTCNKEK